MIALKNILSENKIIKFITVYKEALLQCFFAVLIFILATWRLDEIGQPIILSDEYGYWANSSYFLGQDWSSVTSRIGYYSYGYSILLIPLRLMQIIFGWQWFELYRAAVVQNAFMLVGTYFISIKICKRYFGDLNEIVRSFVCCAAALYSSNMFYAHLTLTETAILFFFWVFLYILMNVIDNPNMINHILLAMVSVYMYTIHQRTIAILITAIIIVIYQKMFNNSKLQHVAGFWGAMAVVMSIHSAIKHGLQYYYYLGNEPKTVLELAKVALSAKTLIIILAGVAVLGFLYLVEKKKYKMILGIMAVVLVVGVVFVMTVGVPGANTNEAVDMRISNNDFSGQWGKIAGIFTLNGFLRLGISITGKWFYMAAATGLVICWGIKDLFKQMFWWCVENAQCMITTIKGGTYTGKRIINDKFKDNIWFFGLFLAFAGTFMICAIYKEGLFKNDDLVHGRYNEFLVGIMLIYSFYVLYKDKHWIGTTVISLALFLAGAALCQHTLTELKRTEFEMCHSVMFGRVFWNKEVPVGKFKIMISYVLPLGLTFIILMKVWGKRFSKYFTLRCALLLLIPAVSWTYLSSQVLENYSISLNRKSANTAPDIVEIIESYDYHDDKNIYYLEDTRYYRYAEKIQFMLSDREIIMTNMQEVPLTEDAFFIMSTSAAGTEAVQQECEIIATRGQYALVINKNHELMKRWGKNER